MIRRSCRVTRELGLKGVGQPGLADPVLAEFKGSNQRASHNRLRMRTIAKGLGAFSILQGLVHNSGHLQVLSVSCTAVGGKERLVVFRCMVTDGVCRSLTFAACNTVTQDARTEWFVYLRDRWALSEKLAINFPSVSFPSGAVTK